jgi:CHAT domain/FHA domain
MLLSESPCLSVAIARLTAVEPDHYAIWVLQAPYPGGYVHHDCVWSEPLTQTWQAWQSLFSLRGLPEIPRVPSAYVSQPALALTIDPPLPTAGQPTSYSSRLMQHLGVSLWQWLFDGPIQSSLDQSQGIAIGQGKPLRLRLEIRDPGLIALPWEIMQPEPGKQAISLSKQLLFSRTTSAVDPLPPLRVEQSLKILLVLGQDTDAVGKPMLKLAQEAAALAQILQQSVEGEASSSFIVPVSCQVKTLLQPTAAELIDQLETENYNVFFYSGHGVPAADGGLLFLQSDATISGTELAQVLTRCRVKLSVFNACWGAQPDQTQHQAIPRSSLAEVLIHHGVPAVLAMRDSIADQEALSFIQIFAKTLAERSPIDEAVAIARQHLLTLYKFNQPAWTLPVLYMHPEFDGELIKPIPEGVTEIPDSSPSWIGHHTPAASLRSLATPHRVWRINGGIMRIGCLEGNDLVLRGPGVSREHAAIFCRDSFPDGTAEPTYYLRDSSRYGTLVLGPDGWHKIHHQEVPLRSQTQLKFGSSQNPPLEFVIDGLTSSSQI